MPYNARSLPLCACLFSVLCFVSPVFASDPPQVTVTVKADSPGIPFSPDFYGLMTEEIDHSFDGGLYAELIQNRNFKRNRQNPVDWTLATRNGGVGSISLNLDDPVSQALPKSLDVVITSAGDREMVGAANDGYWGIPVTAHTTYTASF